MMIRVMTRMRCHLTDRAGLDSNRDSLAARAQIVTLKIIYVMDRALITDCSRPWQSFLIIDNDNNYGSPLF